MLSLLVCFGLFIHAVFGIGDENSYLTIENVKNKFECQSFIGTPALDVAGLSGKIIYPDVCRDIQVSDVRFTYIDYIVIFGHETNSKKECTFEQMYSYLLKNNAKGIIFANPSSIPRIYPFPAEKIIEKELLQKHGVPSCMISHWSSEVLTEKVSSWPQYGHIHNGETEEIIVKYFNGISEIDMFVDGQQLVPQESMTDLDYIVRDTYRTISVKVTLSGQIDEEDLTTFSVSVSDNFGTNLVSWKCSETAYNNEKNEEWKWDNYTMRADDGWVTPKLPSSIPPTDTGELNYTKPWQEIGFPIYIETKSKSGGYVCRGERFKSKIQNGNYEYWLNKDKLTRHDAELACNNKGGHLVSIHNPHDNLVAQLLVPEKDNQVWIGLEDAFDPTLKWLDGTIRDYHNWVRILGKVRNEHCGVMQQDGKWNITKCSNLRESICQKIANDNIPGFPGTNHEPIGEEQCLVFLSESGTKGGIGSIYAPPILLAGDEGGMCHFGSGYTALSCCDKDYMQKTVQSRISDITSKLQVDEKENPQCYKRLREALCWDCMATQGHYLQAEKGGQVSLRICNDTCAELWSYCSSYGPSINAKTEQQFCTKLFKEETDSSYELEFVDDLSTSCFRIDGTRPVVLDYIPNGKIDPNEQILKVIFSESITILPYAQLTIAKYFEGTDYIEYDITFQQSNQISPFMSLETTSKKSDTIVFNLTKANSGRKSCIFRSENEYAIDLDYNFIFDLAGNVAAPGSLSWQVKPTGECYVSAYGGIKFVLFLTSVVFILFGIFYVRNGRHQKNNTSLASQSYGFAPVNNNTQHDYHEYQEDDNTIINNQQQGYIEQEEEYVPPSSSAQREQELQNV